ncbi:TPA: beta strand repeat-containing protein, partial [Haemophilus influenzae]
AQGSGDIAKTGGFVETSGHDLFIKDNAIVDAKEWLLDPDIVSINEAQAGRSGEDDLENNEYISEASDNSAVERKRNKNTPTLTNSTLEKILARGSHVNISASKRIYVNSSINIGNNGHLILWSEGKNSGGIEINEDITSTGGNLTIKSGGWVDIHKNITLGEGTLNITAKGDIAFEDKRGVPKQNRLITGQGNITSGNQKGFRFENISLNGTGRGLLFTTQRGSSAKDNNNITNYFNGTLDVSGSVNISMITARVSWYKRDGGRTHWNVTALNVAKGGRFNLTIDSTGSGTYSTIRNSLLNGITFNNDTTFNIAKGSTANFNIKAPIMSTNSDTANYALFNGNISVLGGGSVNFNLNASSSNVRTPGAIIKSQHFNVSDGSKLNFRAEGSTKTAFLIENDLTLNAAGGAITLKQVEGTDARVGNGVVANKNITFNGGDITFGSQKATTEIKGNVTINANTNATLRGANFNENKSALNIAGNVINNGNLTTDGSIINIGGSLTVAESAKLQAVTNFTFNVAGLFDNKGNSNISIAKGGAKFKDINNTKNLSIATNSSAAYRTIIAGNITNKSGDLNITDNKSDAEIEIGGDISQKEGNLTISSDKINITNQITIKKGVDGEDSSSSMRNQANLTIKTKELKLTQDLNISGFDKAEIVAKNGNDLTIGNSNDGNIGAKAKTVTFNNVKDSKISANGHDVTLNSKVETSDNTNTGDGSGNNAGLTIAAKNVTVNNSITSHKTVNITASENVTTKADATINATNGNVKVTTKTGDIKGQVKSTSGDVEITASGDTLNVSNVSGSAVTITADKGKLTTQAGSSITSAKGQVDLSAKDSSIEGSIRAANVTLNTTGTLTTVTGSNIEAVSGALVINAQDATLNGKASGDRTEVNATNASGSGSVTA